MRDGVIESRLELGIAQRDDDVFDPLGQRLERWIARQSRDFAVARVDRIDAAAIAVDPAHLDQCEAAGVGS
jgi:hypothetical protein